METLKQTCADLVKEKRKLLDDLHSGSAANPSSGLSLPATAHTESSSNTSSTSTITTPADAEKLRCALREYETKVVRLEGANEEWRVEAQRLQQHIVGLRLNKQVQEFEKLNKDFKRTKAQADECKRRLSEAEAELLRTKAALKERDARIRHMKDEYNKLFTALQKIKTPSLAQPTSSSTTGTVSCGHSPSKLNSKMSTRNLFSNAMIDGSGTTGATSACGGACGAAAPTSTASQANGHPYLLEHYKEQIDVLEKEIEVLHVQIRKMIASEYRYKQTNRLLRVEKAQLVDAHDRLRGELDKRVLSSAKRVVDSAHEHLAASSKRGIGGDRDDSMSSRAPTGSSAAVNEVKKLRQRNQFLEEQFRAIVASPGASRCAASGDPRTGASGDDPPSPASRTATASASISVTSATCAFSAAESALQSRDLSTDADSDDGAWKTGDKDHIALTSQLGRSNSVMAIKSDLATPPALRKADSEAHFGLLDPKTLQALQQVRSKARVRPQYAQRPTGAK